MFLLRRMLQKNEAAKGSNKRIVARFLRRFEWRHGRQLGFYSSICPHIPIIRREPANLTGLSGA
jgi:hypothetical protein